MNNTESFTIPATLEFPSLFKPTKPRGSNADEKFNAAVVITAETYDNIVKPYIDGLIASDFQKGESQDSNFKWGFLPCSSKPLRFPEDLTKGMYFGNAKSDRKPEVIDDAQMPVVDPGAIRSGAKVHISINLYAFNKAGNCGIGIGLGPVMFTEAGPSLSSGGGVSAKEAFAGVIINKDKAPVSKGGPPTPKAA